MPAVLKIGQGYDVHRLQAERPLVLGGIRIPYEKGLFGHSDADVAVHAVIDAMLGAAGLGDIGEHFSDTDPAFAGIDSCELLTHTRAKVEAMHYAVVNVDLTIIAQEPKLGPYKEQMRRKLAGLLGLKIMDVNVKAKTNEGLGEIGAGQAIACHAVVALGPPRA